MAALFVTPRPMDEARDRRDGPEWWGNDRVEAHWKHCHAGLFTKAIIVVAAVA